MSITPKIRHYGEVKNGKKIYYNEALYREQLTALEGHKFMEIISPIVKKPSLDQYAYYRGGILPTCHKAERFIHFDKKDDIHSLYFAKLFLTHTRKVELPDRMYEVEDTRSLTELSREEMSEFIDRVKAHCDELRIKLGSPEDYYNKYYNT